MNYAGLKRYQQTAAMGLSNTQCVALLLEKVADHVSTMIEAMDNNNIETRVQECNRALLILRGLEQAVSTHDHQTNTAATFDLKRYYIIFQNLILKSSLKNDRIQAHSIEKNLRSMAAFWRSIDTHSTNEINVMPQGTTTSFCHSV